MAEVKVYKAKGWDARLVLARIIKDMGTLPDVSVGPMLKGGARAFPKLSAEVFQRLEVVLKRAIAANELKSFSIQLNTEEKAAFGGSLKEELTVEARP